MTIRETRRAKGNAGWTLPALLLGLVTSVVGVLGVPEGASGSEANTARQWVDSLVVRSLSEGVWMHTSLRPLPNDTLFPSNGLLVQEEDSLVMVDTAWGPDLTEELIRWADRTLGLTVK